MPRQSRKNRVVTENVGLDDSRAEIAMALAKGKAKGGTEIPTKTPEKNAHNIPANKRYVFNETGNIMLATTDDDNATIQQSVRDVFAEVAVFFAAMTKAISDTPNPDDHNKPYSIYNYLALQKVIDGSGLFIHVTEEDVVHKSNSFGADFSKELVESLLGLATGDGEMSFASAMVASMGDEAKKIHVGGKSSHTHGKVANIVFVCEHLLGMPIVSAIVCYADTERNKETITAGPCFSATHVKSKTHVHKDTYMFVTPSFIKEYAGDLEGVRNDAAYNNFVDYLKATLTGDPIINEVFDPATGKEAISQLDPSTQNNEYEYVLQGENFGTTAGTLEFDTTTSGAPTITPVKNGWSDESVSFTISNSGSIGKPGASIRLVRADKKSQATQRTFYV